MKLRVVLLLFLSTIFSCISDVNLRSPLISLYDNDVYYQNIQAVVAAWVDDSTLPAPTHCDESQVYVSFLDDVDFQSASGYCPYIPGTTCDAYRAQGHSCPNGCAAAFYISAQPPFNCSNNRHHILAITANITNHEDVLDVMRHETLHWLSECSGHQNTKNDFGYPYAGGDFYHRDPRLWDYQNGVMGRARDYVSDQ